MATTAQLMAAKIDESGTRSNTDAQFVPIVQGAQERLRRHVSSTVVDGRLQSFLPVFAAASGMPQAQAAALTWAQAYAILDKLAPKRGFTVPIGWLVVGGIGVLWLVTRD